MILKVGAWARDPLEYKMKNLNMAVFFFYGENDWMRREIADKLLNEGHLKNESQVITIPKSGH
jgi:pimeloyl-ACP methyl ester carboxylesterase